MTEPHIQPPEVPCDSSSEERWLIQRLLNNEARAWREFVLRYQGLVIARVHQTISHCLNSVSPSDRDDVVAEVFALMIHNDRRALKMFSFESSLATWLSVIAHRCSLKYVSRQRRQQAAQFDDSGPDTFAVNSQGPLDAIVNRENQARIRRNMKQLKASDQQVLELYYFDSLGYREIGDRLGISTNAVGPKLHRAQQRLKKLMEEQA